MTIDWPRCPRCNFHYVSPNNPTSICGNCLGNIASAEAKQRCDETRQFVKNRLDAREAQAQERMRLLSQQSAQRAQSQQPASHYQPPTYQSGQIGPLETWARNNPHVGIGDLISGFFMLAAIGGAIWLVLVILPFLLAILGFLFSAALVIGGIGLVIWLFVVIVKAFDSSKTS